MGLPFVCASGSRQFANVEHCGAADEQGQDHTLRFAQDVGRHQQEWQPMCWLSILTQSLDSYDTGVRSYIVLAFLLWKIRVNFYVCRVNKYRCILPFVRLLMLWCGRDYFLDRFWSWGMVWKNISWKMFCCINTRMGSSSFHFNCRKFHLGGGNKLANT